eukprot:TRINITY_DN5305_c0_g1_i1.p1 TRINITY_DN5305_c0_g1~~TRINITY_DN5305_c0_g1_i1.p1  ORF type:complete len:615 (+),score=110.77 TRINITY_DN5305_c0_g1_i1:230-2074(+)
MSISGFLSRENTPWFSWGFGVRRPRTLVPLLMNNLCVVGNRAVSVSIPRGLHTTSDLHESLGGTSNDYSWLENVVKAELGSEKEKRTLAMPPQVQNGTTIAVVPDPIVLPSGPSATPFPPTTTDLLPFRPVSTEAASNHDHQPLPISTSSSPPTANLSSSSAATLSIINSPSPCELDSNTSNNESTPSDDDIIALAQEGSIALHALERFVPNDKERAVSLRRRLVALGHQERGGGADDLADLPSDSSLSYEVVHGACCENVIGYVPVPVGVAGPLLVRGREFMVPMATTEGCLVASTHRGCKVLTAAGGVSAVVLSGGGMTRAPLVRFPDVYAAAAFKLWIESSENFETAANLFKASSRFARLLGVTVHLAGRQAYVRLRASSGDAMGMNMLTKGAELLLHGLLDIFPDMEVLSVSGNVCSDKKSTGVNWVQGRGRSVVAEAVIPRDLVTRVLKCNVERLVSLNTNKNLVGSAIAGAIGGFNAHAANIVTAIYLATGQDVAQNVESSACLTLMEVTPDGDLRLSCSMPCIEVGTVGGGTILPPQAACLSLLGCKGAGATPGENADRLAEVVCSTVMAGELSLMAALAVGDLAKSHLRLNRSSTNLASMNTMPKT